MFGNQPFVQKNFKLVILAIIILSVLPIVFERGAAGAKIEKPFAPDLATAVI